jgi:two-component system, OmpR family, response regulator ChvI
MDQNAADNAASSNSLLNAGPASQAARLVLVDDDDLFRESLGLNLVDEGFAVTSFSNGPTALEWFDNGGEADVVLLDWRMPAMNGLEVLRALRDRGKAVPVIFLTVLSEDIYEEAALAGGAVDFIDKSRRLSILLRRLKLIIEGTRPAPEPAAAENRGPGDRVQIGQLELRFDISRASWSGKVVDLTLTEFKIVALMVMRTSEDVSYRELYDLVHGKDFIAGYGVEGYRANVRTFIKRIRKKFRDVDPDFDHIENYAGFGYRWTAEH